MRFAHRIDHHLFLAIASVLALAACTGTTDTLPPASVHPTAATAPTPSVAPTPLALSGTGSKVLTISLGAGTWKVSWTAQGTDNFIVHLHGGGTEYQGLVNEIPPNPSSGETLVTVQTGSYILEVNASTLTWTITFTPL